MRYIGYMLKTVRYIHHILVAIMRNYPAWAVTSRREDGGA